LTKFRRNAAACFGKFCGAVGTPTLLARLFFALCQGSSAAVSTRAVLEKILAGQFDHLFFDSHSGQSLS